MPEKSEVFSLNNSSHPGRKSHTAEAPQNQGRARDVLEIVVIFGLILVSEWTKKGTLNTSIDVAIAACVVVFAIAGRWSAREMGVTRPLSGAGTILLSGAIACGLIALLGYALRFGGPGSALTFSKSWHYIFWALAQQFMLQSIFFLQLEALVGSKPAVFASAALFSVAHIPNPVLAPLAFLGGLLFCELFRRFRNIYPLGVIHGSLGLIIAARLPDHWLHRMRVGVGYLMLHR